MTLPSDNRYLAAPPSGTGPGVLVLHAWWGLNDFIRGFCDWLAQAGFTALAPDMFAGKIARTPEEAERLVSGSNEEDNVPPVILSALEELRRQPGASGGVGVVGFSFGGYWALWLAGQQPKAVRAVTIFYSTGDADFTEARAAFLGHFAVNDPFEPLEGVRELEQRLQAAGREAAFYVYPGTGHWFAESDRPDAYEPASAQLAWERTIEFLQQQLGK